MIARALLVGGILLGATAFAGAAPASGIPVPNVRIDLDPAPDAGEVSASLQILALLTVLSLAPAILILTTAFTRIVVILSFVRTALGTPTIPPNPVLIGLALFLTFFVMAPTWQKVYDEAVKPGLVTKEIPLAEAYRRAQGPLKEFMLANTYDRDLQLFLDIRDQRPESVEELDIFTLIPAFVLSELKTAFLIGFYIFVPFVIIDLIVASGLMSMGMMMLPPMVVSLPAKLLIFVLADGWHVMVQAILAGYG